MPTPRRLLVVVVPATATDADFDRIESAANVVIGGWESLDSGEFRLWMTPRRRTSRARRRFALRRMRAMCRAARWVKTERWWERPWMRFQGKGVA